MKKELNTMDTFYKGFKIIRDGKVITLTEQEMSDFRYLEKAVNGKNCLEVYNPLSDDEIKIIKVMSRDEEICHGIEEDIMNILFQDCGSIEADVIRKYIEKRKSKGAHIKS